MPTEYWEITHERATATCAVWYMDQLFEMKNCDYAGHVSRTAALPGLAAARALAEGNLSDAREDCLDFLAEINELNSRVPGIIKGRISADDDLHGQIDKIQAIDMNVSEAQSLRRARLVEGLWVDFNAAQATEIPAKPALSVKYKKKDSEDPAVDITAAAFHTLITTTAPEAIATREEKLRLVNNAKTALRTAEAKLDRDNKRWYLAWLKTYPAGTAEGDAALSQVPTEEGTQPPNALQISSIIVHGDRTVTVNYPDNGGEHATSLELLHKRAGEEAYGHTTPVARPSQTLGPFDPFETVTFITRVANSTDGNVLSEPVSAVMGA